MVTGRLGGDGFAMARAAALAGAGVALLPGFLCLDELAHGALVRVLPRHAHRGQPVYLVLPSPRLVPARVAALRDFLVAELRAIPWAPPRPRRDPSASPSRPAVDPGREDAAERRHPDRRAAHPMKR
jgi:hypothetical protein